MTRQWFALLFCVLAGTAVAEIATFDRDDALAYGSQP